MEGRRIEGVILDASLLRQRAHEAYETARTLEVKILSVVPEALFEALGDIGSRVRATVTEVRGPTVTLMLENGFEIEAKNNLALPVREGEELTMVVQSKNPLIFRVEESFSGLRGINSLLKDLVLSGVDLFKSANPKETLLNSGLFYERKVWDFIRGALPFESVERDQKYTLLKNLEGYDTSKIETLLRRASEDERLRPVVERALSLLREGNKLEFVRYIPELSRTLEGVSSRLRVSLKNILTSLGNITKNLVSSISSSLKAQAVEVTISQPYVDTQSPKFLDIVGEAIRDLKEGKFREFTAKMELLGLRIENPERLPQIRTALIRTIDSLLKGALLTLKAEVGVEDTKRLVKEIERLKEEIERVDSLKRELSRAVGEIKEDLNKLETINYLQAYMVSTQGRKVFIPFGEKERGLLAFSKNDSYRIFIKVSLNTGYIGVLITAPKVEDPKHLKILFKTDREDVEFLIKRGIEDLERDLEEIGFEVKDIEVIREEEREFDREVFREFREEGLFNLRV